jgi:hypothetical protein
MSGWDRLFGAGMLSMLYFGVVSWAESTQHALEYFWQIDGLT